MSDGRWVWVPEGWRVVPPYEDYPMCPTSRDVLEEVFAAAPTPPSGWRRDAPPWGKPILAQRWSETTVFEVIIAYTKGETSGYWWTPLPPPPEVKP